MRAWTKQTLAVVLLTAPAHADAATPDFSGLWTNNTLTQLERPDDFKTLVVTEAEAKAYEAKHKGKPPEIPDDTIGAGGRYYETMAFGAKKEGPYWDADVGKQINFKSEWAIWADAVDKLPNGSDNIANAMHDAVVRELSVAPRQPKERK